MNRLKINEIIVAHVNTNAKIEACITPIDDFEVTKLQNKYKRFSIFIRLNAAIFINKPLQS